MENGREEGKKDGWREGRWKEMVIDGRDEKEEEEEEMDYKGIQRNTNTNRSTGSNLALFDFTQLQNKWSSVSRSSYGLLRNLGIISVTKRCIFCSSSKSFL